MAEDKETLILDLDKNTSEENGSSLSIPANAFQMPCNTRREEKSRIITTLSTVGVRRSSRPQSSLRRFVGLHGKALVAALLIMISFTSILIFFPPYLELVTSDAESKSSGSSDGYSAALALTTISTALFLLVGVFLQVKQCFAASQDRINVFNPVISGASTLKIGVSMGLSLLTVCYAWVDHKVLCNMQLPLLGLVFLFASVTHSLNRWKDLGYRRSFAMLTVIGGVFISVDFSLMDHERCRGVHPPPKDSWSWKVHLVWTLAFVVAIWLWTVAIFSLESFAPLKLEPRLPRGAETCIRMKVLTPNRNARLLSEPLQLEQISDIYGISARRSNVYFRVNFLHIFKSLMWFHVATWIVVLSLFWTEFVPGFGKGDRQDTFSMIEIYEKALVTSFGSEGFWILVISAFAFAHAFTYLVISTGCPLVAMGVMSVGFPTVAIWWSMFQIQSHFLVWMPVMAVELICAFLGFPLILSGTYYLFLFNVLRRTRFSPTLI